MKGRADERADHRQRTERFEDFFPDRDGQRHGRVFRKTIELRPVGKLQHVDHARPADAGWIVNSGLRPAVGFQLIDAMIGDLDEPLFRPELQAAGRARLDASGFKAIGDAVGAERAFVNLLGPFVQPRDVERAARHAVLTADTILLLEVHDAIGVLYDRPRRRARLQTAGFRAMLALIFRHQPAQALAAIRVPFDVLVEANQVPEVRGQIGLCLICAELDLRRFNRLIDPQQIVPFLTGDLARLAPDAGRGIDELGDPRRIAHACGRRSAGGDAFEFHVARHIYTFSRLTRNALYSGVDELGSSAVGVRVLASGPADPPANPQWIGKPICQTVRPSTLSAGLRLVTIALPSIEPRAEVIFTRSPFLTPFSSASPSGISTKNSGCK